MKFFFIKTQQKDTINLKLNIDHSLTKLRISVNIFKSDSDNLFKRDGNLSKCLSISFKLKLFKMKFNNVQPKLHLGICMYPKL